MAKQKFYAVKEGIKTGIFNTWAECEQQVKGFKNAKYKSFSTKQEAQDYLNDVKKQNLNFSPTTLTAYVDGSYDSANKVYGWGYVLIDHESNVKKFCGADNKEQYIEHRNVAGEVTASIHAITYAIKHNFKTINIFYDYQGIEKWATNDWKANNELTKKYVAFINKAKKDITMNFNKVQAHTGDTFNELADKLAKKGIVDFITKTI